MNFFSRISNRLENIKNRVEISRMTQDELDDDQEALQSLMQTDDISREHAAALILVSLANLDQKFTDEEYTSIERILRRNFELSQKEVSELVQQAGLMSEAHRGATRIAESIKGQLKPEQIAKLREAIDEVIAADGNADGFEMYMRDAVIKILES